MKAAEDAIRQYFTAAWGAKTPVVWPNEATEVPTSPPAPWVHIEIIGETEVPKAFGGGRGANEWDWIGRIEAHVLVPRQEGTARASQYCDDIAAIFRGQRFSGVSCWAAPRTDSGVPADNGNFWVMTQLVDFTYRFTG